jgi:cell volume regulation protein A
MAVILTLTLVQAFSAGNTSWTAVLLAVPVQLAVGVGIGAFFGWLACFLLKHIRIQTTGLYPVLTLALAFLSFGTATLAFGSGFLAVFATGLVLGSANLPYRQGLARVHDALAWLSQVSMFLMMGLLVFPSQLLPVAGTGLLLALILAFVARPLAVVLCLLPFHLPAREVVYVSWIGLRGAVPIVLATFPILAQVPGAMRVFNLVFFIVVASTLIPGATIRAVTRWLKLSTPERPLPPAVLEINSTFPLNGELTSFLIDPSVAVCDAFLRDIEFPSGAAVVLIIRGRDLIAPRGQTKIQAGDHVYVFFQPQDHPMIELLFGSPELG